MQITANYDVILKNATFWQFPNFFGVNNVFFFCKIKNLDHLNAFRRNFFNSVIFRFFEVCFLTFK